MSNRVKRLRGKVWRHWMNREGKQAAKVFVEIAAKHGVEILVNRECYDFYGQLLPSDDFFKDWMAYWRLQDDPIRDLSAVWREVEKTPEWRRG